MNYKHKNQSEKVVLTGVSDVNTFSRIIWQQKFVLSTCLCGSWQSLSFTLVFFFLPHENYISRCISFIVLAAVNPELHLVLSYNEYISIVFSYFISPFTNKNIFCFSYVFIYILDISIYYISVDLYV